MFDKKLLENTLIINEAIDIKGLMDKLKKAIIKFKNWLTEKILTFFNKIVTVLINFKKKILSKQKQKEEVKKEEVNNSNLLKTTVNIKEFLLKLKELKKLIFVNISLLGKASENSQEIVEVKEKIEKLIDINDVVSKEYKYYAPELIDISVKNIQDIIKTLNNQMRVLNAYKVKLDEKECRNTLGYINNTTNLINEITRFCGTVTSKIVA